MKYSFAQFTEQWSSLHGNTPVRGAVGGWLKIAFQVGRLACRLRITANMLTGLGVVGAVATAFAAPHWWAALFLALSLLADGLDGSVAILARV